MSTTTARIVPDRRFVMSCAALALAAGCTAGKTAVMQPTPQATATTSTPAQPTPTRHGHVTANGVSYYYETYGHGEPLLLLHGGLGSIEMFAPILPALAAHREVIAVDLHGHGRTRLGTRPISLIDQGDDLAIVLDQLGFAQVDVLGYSMGGGVAFRLAVQHPERVRRLVMASACPTQDAFYPELIAMQAGVSAAAAPMMHDTPMYRSYVQIAPDPAEFPALLDRVGELMRTPFDWRDDVKRLSMPTMVVFGDSDMFRLDKIVELYNLLGGGLRDGGWQREHVSPNRLAILPGVTHYEMFMSPALVAAALPFLDGTDAPPRWSDQASAR